MPINVRQTITTILMQCRTKVHTYMHAGACNPHGHIFISGLWVPLCCIHKLLVSYFWRANTQSRGSCTVDLSPWENQLLLSFDTNCKDSVMLPSLYCAHNCTKHTPQLLPSGSKAMPYENHLLVMRKWWPCVWTQDLRYIVSCHNHQCICL